MISMLNIALLALALPPALATPIAQEEPRQFDMLSSIFSEVGPDFNSAMSVAGDVVTAVTDRNGNVFTYMTDDGGAAAATALNGIGVINSLPTSIPGLGDATGIAGAAVNDPTGFAAGVSTFAWSVASSVSTQSTASVASVASLAHGARASQAAGGNSGRSGSSGSSDSSGSSGSSGTSSGAISNSRGLEGGHALGMGALVVGVLAGAMAVL